jgi:hypothetical protein
MFHIYAQGNNIDYGLGSKIYLENVSSPYLTTLAVNNIQHFLMGYQDSESKKWKIDLINSSNINQTVNSITFANEKLINIKGHEDSFLAII